VSKISIDFREENTISTFVEYLRWYSQYPGTDADKLFTRIRENIDKIFPAMIYDKFRTYETLLVSKEPGAIIPSPDSVGEEFDWDMHDYTRTPRKWVP
jgi:hypothetical protein